jgi:molybdopterin converting factor small subunit
MMKITVKLFAAMRDAAGADSVEIDVREGATIADVRTALIERFPEQRALLARVLFAIDAQYAGDTVEVPSQSEIACIPPVSGG